jgi:hypothetical protein
LEKLVPGPERTLTPLVATPGWAQAALVPMSRVAVEKSAASATILCIFNPSSAGSALSPSRFVEASKALCH